MSLRTQPYTQQALPDVQGGAAEVNGRITASEIKRRWEEYWEEFKPPPEWDRLISLVESDMLKALCFALDIVERNQNMAPTAVQINEEMYHKECIEGIEGDQTEVQIEDDSEECCEGCDALLIEAPSPVDETEDVDEVEKREAHDQVSPGQAPGADVQAP